MDKTLALRSRLNSSFGILALFSVVSFAISVFCTVAAFICYGILEVFSASSSIYSAVEFYVLFAIPQVLLPVLTVLVGCLIPVIGKAGISESLRSEKVPIHYFILCICIFPGLSTVFSYISYFITEALVYIGIPIPDINSAIPSPEGLFQILVLFFVMAVLPAICEEVIYRGFVMRGLSEYGKVGAIVVSSIAFGLMHATVQQIPFAFAVGLFLGYVALRFKSLVLPMALHFINNFIACVLTVLQSELDSDLVGDISVCLDIFFIALSLLSIAIFVILTVHERKSSEPSQFENVSIEGDCVVTGETPVVPQKVRFAYAVTHSWGFWLFVAVFSFTTLMNIVALSIAL